MANKYIYGKAHHNKFPFKKRVHECFTKYMDEIMRANPSAFRDCHVNNLFVDLRNEICYLVDEIYQRIKVESEHNVEIQPSSRKRMFKLQKGVVAGKNCQICGESRAISSCHIIPREEGGTDSEANLILLCPNHHYLFDEAKLSKKEFNKIILKEKTPDAIEYFQKIHRIRHEMFWRYRTNKSEGCNCGSLDFDYDVTYIGNEVQPCLRCKKCGDKWILGWHHPLQKFSIAVYEISENISDDEKTRRVLEAKEKIKHRIQDYLRSKNGDTSANSVQ